jgi:recombination protein U
MKNEGKKFEQDFENSVPENFVFIRLKDAGGWSNADNTRFTPKNECDGVLFDGEIFCMLELKSHLGKSIPKDKIKESQIKALAKQQSKEHTFPGVIFNFRELEETYIVHIKYVEEFYYSKERASFPVDWCREHGIKIPQKKKKVRYTYDIVSMLMGCREAV